jgi:peptide/nickel transport system permease protein
MTRGPMLRFVARRLLQAVPLLFGIVSATFIAAHAAPGDPMDMYLDPTRRRQADPELIEAIRRKHGLDQPIHVQYVRWVANVARGDLGESFRYRRPVADLLLERIPYTLQVTFLALLFGTLLGVALGIFSAVKQYTALDEAITLGSLAIYAMPLFWLALMLVLVFSVNLGWFPTSQTRSLHYDSLSAAGRVLDRLWHLALPVFVLGVGMAAGKARYMRGKLLEVLSEEYVLAARARGLPERRVILRHALRNALIPVITMLGMSLPFLVGGSLFVESVFGWPGIGTLAVEATSSRDYPLLLATTLLTAVMVVLGNLLADVLYAVVDPRVAYERRPAA